MKPLILITCSASEQDFFTRRRYCQRLADCGASVLIAPAVTEENEIPASAAAALLLTGGGDISPALYNEPRSALCEAPDLIRDNFELKLAREFIAARKPVLGICRGMQVLNVLFGGTLYQDMSEFAGAIEHDQQAEKNIGTHEVRLSGRLRDMWGESLSVNSFHHQGVKSLGCGLCLGAESSDGLCEGFYAPQGFTVGVQWHPEHMTDAASESLFRAFVLAAKGE